jgi:malonyl-CoA decarboxylase
MSTPNPHIDDTGAFRVARRPDAFRRMLSSILDVGRGLLPRTRNGDRAKGRSAEHVGALCRQLLDHRGEASGLALADEILSLYQELSASDRVEFFELLVAQFEADHETIANAATAYLDAADATTLAALSKAVEAPRRKLFRRLNMVPDGIGRLVKLRSDLLNVLGERPHLRPLDTDLRNLLIAWFNRGFLVMERIDWTSPANVLEKIIEYEAVHEINGWDDLRVRLADDRRCFAFFHPAMPDDPLIFVEVALTGETADAIRPLLATDRAIANSRHADSAVFYSISNCHHGLQGISFGHFLLKQVIEELRRDLDNITTFVTLSPIPGFRGWLESIPSKSLPEARAADVETAREFLVESAEPSLDTVSEEQRASLMRLCAYYLLTAKAGDQPLDPVARFHMSNGASLQRIHWAADRSQAGLDRSVGIMVNYLYDLADIEKNHERYFAEGLLTASAEVRKLASVR